MKTSVLSLLVAIATASAGCVATHKVQIDSDPPGAHIEVNGSYLGQAPLEYEFESGYAEKIWPQDTSFTARVSDPTWEDDSKSFTQWDELPERIIFILRRTSPPETAGGDDFEPIEFQKDALDETFEQATTEE